MCLMTCDDLPFGLLTCHPCVLCIVSISILDMFITFKMWKLYLYKNNMKPSNTKACNLASVMSMNVCQIVC